MEKSLLVNCRWFKLVMLIEFEKSILENSKESENLVDLYKVNVN